MRLPTVRNWKAQSMTAPVTDDATPPAAAALLLTAVAWPEDAALTPYVGCAHVFDAHTSTNLYTRHLAVMVAPGAVHARAAVGVSWTPWGAAGTAFVDTPHAITSTASGAAPADVILADKAAPNQTSTVAFGPTSAVALSSDTADDNPAASKRRRIELQTLTAPYVEPMSVTECTSFSVAVSHQVADLETL